MAQIDKAGADIAQSVGSGDSGQINWLHVEAGVASGCGGIAIDSKDSEGAITTVYLWPDTSNMFRYGTTKPTVSTRDTAGTAIGS